MSYVVSRLVATNTYAIYKKESSGKNVLIKSLKIPGKADVVNRKTLITETGIIKEFTDEEIDFLQSNPVFRKQVSYGVIDIVRTKREAEKKVENEELEKDMSAPLTNADMGGIKVETSSKNDEKDVDEYIEEIVNKNKSNNKKRNKNKEDKE